MPSEPGTPAPPAWAVDAVASACGREGAEDLAQLLCLEADDLGIEPKAFVAQALEDAQGVPWASLRDVPYSEWFPDEGGR